jgi:hypothetical protein
VPGTFTFVATILRTASDFLPTRAAGLNWASYLWMLAAAIWSLAILPKVRIPDSSEMPTWQRRGTSLPG